MLPDIFRGTLSGNNFMTMFSAFGSGSRITYSASDDGFWIERGGVAAITQEDRDILLGFGVTSAETTSLAAGIITREFVGMGAFNPTTQSTIFSSIFDDDNDNLPVPGKPNPIRDILVPIGKHLIKKGKEFTTKK